MRVLSGDVGGTKTYLALHEVDDEGFVRELRRERYASSAFPGLADMIGVFLGGGSDARVDRAGIGVAGPVVDDVVKTTNLPWRIDARVLERTLGIGRVTLLNDFEAIALGIPRLPEEDFVVLQDLPADPHGPVVVLGAGTGLGAAVMVPTGSPGHFRVLRSEGGHTDFAPRDEREIDLLRYLLERHERVSYERVVSGPGLLTLYRFVVARGIAPELEETRARMAEEDPSAVIGQRALAGDDPACVEAARMFVGLYGAKAGNLALDVIPTGGLYVAGGVAIHLLPLLQDGGFLRAFRSKGRMSHLLEAVRVSVVRNSRVGLTGALHAALCD
jgi:glucokinase